MNIKLLEEPFILARGPITENPSDPVCRHADVVRSEGRVYLYNAAYELVRILQLADFGAVEKRRGIPHGERVIEVTDGPRIHAIAEPMQQLLCTWSEELGLRLFDFDGTQRFHLPEAYCHACFDERHDLLWTVRRDDNHHVTLMLHDYAGTRRASLPMEDPIAQSDFYLRPLPWQSGMAVTFACGQDGSQDYFLLLEQDTLRVTHTLPQELTWLFDLGDGTCMLLDFYDMVLHHRTFPGLAQIASFAYPTEEWCVGAVLPLSGQKLILSNEYNYRHYLFDIPTMTMEEELVVEGYEPAEDSEGILCSDIREISYEDGRLVFHITRKVNGRQEFLRLVSAAIE